jgi:Protein of unknown function (DUF4038)
MRRGWSRIAVLAAALGGCKVRCADPGGLAAPPDLPPLPPPPARLGPLRVHPTNRRYFADADGRAVFLAGMHTWTNLQDAGGVMFDYPAYLAALRRYHHNFFRLWVIEEAKGALDSHVVPGAAVEPSMFVRTGPGAARDGKPRFDLTRLNQAYFDRLRARVQAAREAGIYVSVMLFNGWSLGKVVPSMPANPWLGHPFNAANNVNGINGDPDGDAYGSEVHTLAIPAVTAIQRAYVAKVIATVNDLDNVVYEISNESPPSSRAWQYDMVRFIHEREAGLPQQHPVGMTAFYDEPYTPEDHLALVRSPADWIGPGRLTDVPGVDNVDSPAPADGQHVVVIDTDHVCGLCADEHIVWKSFTRGNQFLYMDVYDQTFLAGTRDMRSIRNMGYAVDLGRRIDLGAMRPAGELASTGYCLSHPGGSYVAYLPGGGSLTLDLRDGAGQMFTVEWLDPGSGRLTAGSPVAGGGRAALAAPFSGAAVVHLEAAR